MYFNVLKFEVVFIRIILFSIFAHVSPFSSKEEWHTKQNTAVLFWLWVLKEEVWKLYRDRQKERKRNRERRLNWRVPREYFHRLQSSLSFLAVSDFNCYLDLEEERERERERERRRKKKRKARRQKDVEKSLSLFWDVCRMYFAMYFLYINMKTSFLVLFCGKRIFQSAVFSI